jgi:predicted dienelactone hydrolase
MSTMVTEVYDALVEAGASEDKARKAAAVLADYDREFGDIKGDLKLLKWMQGATFAGIVALLLRAFAH